MLYLSLFHLGHFGSDCIIDLAWPCCRNMRLHHNRMCRSGQNISIILGQDSSGFAAGKPTSKNKSSCAPCVWCLENTLARTFDKYFEHLKGITDLPELVPPRNSGEGYAFQQTCRWDSVKKSSIDPKLTTTCHQWCSNFGWDGLGGWLGWLSRVGWVGSVGWESWSRACLIWCCKHGDQAYTHAQAT